MQPTSTPAASNSTVYHGRAWSIIHGDCLTAATAQPDDSIQLLLTSPPYPGLHGFALTGAAYHAWLHVRLAAWVPKVCTQTGVIVLVYKYGRTPDGWFDLDQLLLLKEIEQQHGLRLIGRPAVHNRRRLDAKKEVGQASRYRPSRVKTFRPGRAPNA